MSRNRGPRPRLAEPTGPRLASDLYEACGGNATDAARSRFMTPATPLGVRALILMCDRSCIWREKVNNAEHISAYELSSKPLIGHNIQTGRRRRKGTAALPRNVEILRRGDGIREAVLTISALTA